MENMKDFFFRFYRPNNAVLTISGNVKFEEIVPMVEKWFGDIPSGPEINRQFPQEEKQTKHRIFEVQRNVPADMLFKGWPTCGRLEPDFYAYDMLSDLFGSGQSSYLYQKFVMEEAIFSDISAYISGTLDPGVFIIGGRPAEGVSIEEANQKLDDYLYQLPANCINSHDLQKVKNRVESIILQNDIKIEDRSSSLAVAECFSCAEDFNDETKRYFAVTEEQINTLCNKMFHQEQEATMLYKCAN